MSVIEKFRDKKILIWGYGREGKATEHFLQEKCAVKSIQVFEGKREEIDESQYDYIIKSPGIPVLHLGEKFISQTQIFMEQFGSQVIGITGTKGKSTTSALLYETLKRCLDRPVLLVGNIGLPCLDSYDEITPDTVIVFELSCHQLADLRVSPHIGVFLNLYEEHLDYYKVMEEYYRAKCNIGANQKKGDVLYIGAQVSEFAVESDKVVISYGEKQDYKLLIPGEHNKYNAEYVYRIATQQFGADPDKVCQAMAQFRGLPHRLQLVDTVDGVTFYDDSISTIPEATIAATNSIPRVETVIIGGMDRHIDYRLLETFIEENTKKQFILAYETGERIYQELVEKDNCHLVADLKEAVSLAKRITPPNSSCVMSPAAASYGYFKNFEERGDYFQTLVRE